MTPRMLAFLIMIGRSLRDQVFKTHLPLLLPKIHCEDVVWSVEHVIPRSLIQRTIANDPLNLIPIPVRLNNARSNYKYGDVPTGSVLVPACRECSDPKCPMRGKLFHNASMVVFEPPEIYKPFISESVVAMLLKYPELRSRIEEFVMEPHTLHAWGDVKL